MDGTLKDRWLVALCVARALMYSIFMVYAACVPVLLGEWGISAAEAGTVSGAFMLAYAASLVASSWIAGRCGARRVFMWSAWSGGLTALLFGLYARDYSSALVLYALAASTLGGTYAPAVMLFADRYTAEVRGRAIGMLIASTSLGYAFSLLLSGFLIGAGGYRLAFLVCGALPLAGAVIAAIAMRGTTNRIHAVPAGRPPALRALLRNRDASRLIGAYAGHSWEVLGMWQWLPAFLAASLATSGGGIAEAAVEGAGLAALLHVCGSLASSSMGRLSDHLGRKRVLVALAAAGAACSLGIGWLLAAPFAAVFAVALVYGFVTIGDSPVLSTALTESVAPDLLGTALALRSVLGFGGGAISPVVFGAVLDLYSPAAAPGVAWGLAFASLALGGLLATGCAVGVGRARA